MTVDPWRIVRTLLLIPHIPHGLNRAPQICTIGETLDDWQTFAVFRIIPAEWKAVPMLEIV